MIIPPRNTKVLYVDDEKNLLSSFTSLLRKENLQAYTLDDSTQIEQMLASVGPFALVISDQRMPGKDGAAVLETVARTHPDTIRIMMTGHADLEATLRAVNKGGISRYVAKPWIDNDLRELVSESVARFNLASQNQFLLKRLGEQNLELERLLDGTIAQTVSLLGDMISYISPNAGAFAERSKRLGAAALALYPDLDPKERWEIMRALDLFCLGLAVLPAWVQVSINKQGLAALERFPVAKNHHIFAAGLLKGIPQFENVARIIRFLERDFDGSGEPMNEPLKQMEIPFGARLLHILVDIEKNSTPNFRGSEVLERMARRTGKYDNGIIASMLGAPHASTRHAQQTAVDVTELVPGMTLLDDLVTKGGNILLRAPSTLTDTAILIAIQWNSSDPIIGPVRVILYQ
jgi:response regulator RpfG family c-di-GMP phosphodiesterase